MTKKIAMMSREEALAEIDRILQEVDGESHESEFIEQGHRLLKEYQNHVTERGLDRKGNEDIDATVNKIFGDRYRPDGSVNTNGVSNAQRRAREFIATGIKQTEDGLTPQQYLGLKKAVVKSVDPCEAGGVCRIARSWSSKVIYKLKLLHGRIFPEYVKRKNQEIRMSKLVEYLNRKPLW